MRAAMVLWGVLACGLLWAQPSEPTELRVRVVNRAQQPLTNARVGALAVDFRRLQVMPATEPLMQPVDAQGAARLQWHPAHQATVQEILAGERGGAVVLLVSAPDHVPLCRALTYPIAAEQTVALRTGQTVHLRLKPALSPPDDFGTRLPFQKPVAWDEVFFAPFDADLFVAPLESLADREGLDIPSLQVLNALTRLYLFPGFGIERVSATEYRLTLPPQMDGTAWLWVNRPDWLVGYATEIRPEEIAAGVIERALSTPALLEVRVDLQNANLQGQDGSLMLYRQAGGMYVACARAAGVAEAGDCLPRPCAWRGLDSDGDVYAARIQRARRLATERVRACFGIGRAARRRHSPDRTRGHSAQRQPHGNGTPATGGWDANVQRPRAGLCVRHAERDLRARGAGAVGR
jgi:hypothetical protein